MIASQPAQHGIADGESFRPRRGTLHPLPQLKRGDADDVGELARRVPQRPRQHPEHTAQTQRRELDRDTDGRKRFVNVVMPHIGLDSDGTSGVVMRAGQTGPSTACAALIGLHEQMRAGRYANDLDWDDVEMSLVAMLLGRHVGHDHDLDLWGLTDLARRVATGEIVRLSADLLECADTDVAMFSCVLIHGPEGDRVVVHEASAWLGSNSERVALVV